MRQYRIDTTEYSIQAPFNMRIAFPSDFHNGDHVRILRKIRDWKPDIILMPGDLVKGYYPKDGRLVVEHSERILPFLRGCVQIAPTYFSYGNHECLLCEEDIELLRSTGITILDNEWIELPDTGGQRILLGGLTSGHVISFRRFRNQSDSTDRYPVRRKPHNVYELRTESKWLDDFEKEEGYKILLSHHPEYWRMREPYIAGRRIDLTLSGHAHGGQWRFFGQGILAPGQGLFPKYVRGIHQGDGPEAGKMVVSAGLNNTYWMFPRFGNPCELIFIELNNN
ncbi:MAG: metallophosphoesterase [Mogibacterium sp.]|nr:metallophosphoesterase [Mogibacterium sp.]